MAMYCPNCAKENSGREKYCRSCGLHLEFVSKVAAAEAAGLRKRTANHYDVESLLERTPSTRALLPGFLMVMAGTLVAYLGNEVFAIHGIAVAGIILLILGLCFIGYRALSPKRARSYELSGPATAPLDESPVPLSLALPDAAPSVTEHTTKQLDTAPERVAERPRDAQPSQ
jgi:hypothetical protein